MTELAGVATDARATGAPRARGYRYPGSPPFADSDLDRLVFRGRESEAKEVIDSILSFDLFVIFGVSGTGKTSLLNAGVFEALRARDLWPFVLRLNDPTRKPGDLVAAELEAPAPASRGVDITRHPSAADGPTTTLWDLLSALEVWRGNVLQTPVLVFDQFEELFTLGFSDDDRRDFIVELGEVVRRHRIPDRQRTDSSRSRLPAPEVKIVLILREDSLGELDALSTHIPQIMRNRFRLQGLDLEQAKSAILDPAATDDTRLNSSRFSYTADAARQILDFLRMRHVRGEEQLAAKVDPSQLQIICQHIERSILPRKARSADGHPVEITCEDLGGTQGLSSILSDFYWRVIDALDPDDRERARALCESGLISSHGRRLSLEEVEIEEAYGVSVGLLNDLIDNRLLRAEPRVGSIYYELAHDTLVAGILDQRSEWMTLREQEVQAVHLDRWAFGLTLLNLPFGLLSGPLIAVGLIALRSPPYGRKGRWRPKAALGVGIGWQVVWSAVAIDNLFIGMPTTGRWAWFGLLFLQPAFGLAIGLNWSIKAGSQGRRRWQWVFGLLSAALVMTGFVGLQRTPPNFVEGIYDDTKPSSRDTRTIDSRAEPIVVGSGPVDDGVVEVTVPSDATVQQELQIVDTRTVTVDVIRVERLDPVVSILNDDGVEIASDDDGGGFPNSRIEVELDPGAYVIEVRGFTSSAGSARIEVN